MPRFNESLHKFHSLHEHSHRDALKGAEWPIYTSKWQKAEDVSYLVACVLVFIVIMFII